MIPTHHCRPVALRPWCWGESSCGCCCEHEATVKVVVAAGEVDDGLPLSGDSLSLAVAVVSAVDLLFPEEQCAQLAHTRETLAFLCGRVAPWL